LSNIIDSDDLKEKGVNAVYSKYENERIITLEYNGNEYDLIEIVPFRYYKLGPYFMNRKEDELNVVEFLKTNIFNTLKILDKKKHVLVYCHNRKWDDNRPHWLKKQIEAYCNRYNKDQKELIFLTVDVFDGGDIKMMLLVKTLLNCIETILILFSFLIVAVLGIRFWNRSKIQ